MNWKTIREVAWYVGVFVLAVYLIEAEGQTRIDEMAGDLFGAFGLVILGIYMALNE